MDERAVYQDPGLLPGFLDVMFFVSLFHFSAFDCFNIKVKCTCQLQLQTLYNRVQTTYNSISEGQF